MKKLFGLMLVALSTFTLLSCEDKIDYKENPYIKSAKEKYDMAITSVNFTIYINPTYGGNHYSQIDDDTILMFDEMKKSDRCQNVDWLGISYVETSIGPKMIIFPRYIKKEQALFDAIKVVDLFEHSHIETIKTSLLEKINDQTNIDLENLSFTGATSYYQTNQFNCSDHFFVGLDIMTQRYYSKSFKPELLNKDGFVYHFSVPLLNNDEKKPLWFEVSVVNYRIWFYDEGMFITESSKDIKERYIYPYVKDVESSV